MSLRSCEHCENGMIYSDETGYSAPCMVCGGSGFLGAYDPVPDDSMDEEN